MWWPGAGSIRKPSDFRGLGPGPPGATASALSVLVQVSEISGFRRVSVDPCAAHHLPVPPRTIRGQRLPLLRGRPGRGWCAAGPLAGGPDAHPFARPATPSRTPRAPRRQRPRRTHPPPSGERWNVSADAVPSRTQTGDHVDDLEPADRHDAAGDTGRHAAALLLEERFAIVPEWVLDADISDAAVGLYAVLLRYGQSSGRRMPSRRTLADRLRKKSVDSVDRALRELVGIGAVEVTRRCRDGVNLTNSYLVRATRSGVTDRATRGRGGRKDAATPGRTGAARVAAPARPNPEFLTENTPPPRPSSTAPDARDAGVENPHGTPPLDRRSGRRAQMLALLGVSDLVDVAARCADLRRRHGLPAGLWDLRAADGRGRGRHPRSRPAGRGSDPGPARTRRGPRNPQSCTSAVSRSVVGHRTGRAALGTFRYRWRCSYGCRRPRSGLGGGRWSARGAAATRPRAAGRRRPARDPFHRDPPRCGASRPYQPRRTGG